MLSYISVVFFLLTILWGVCNAIDQLLSSRDSAVLRSAKDSNSSFKLIAPTTLIQAGRCYAPVRVYIAQLSRDSGEQYFSANIRAVLCLPECLFTGEEYFSANIRASLCLPECLFTGEEYFSANIRASLCLPEVCLFSGGMYPVIQAVELLQALRLVEPNCTR